MAVSPRSSKVGINLGTANSWGTATAVGAGDGVWVTDDLKVQLKKQVDEDDSAGQDFIGSMQVANHVSPKIEVPTLLHYNDTFQNVLWALACGTGGTSPAQVGTSTAYTNTFEPATNKTGLFATIVRDKVTYIEEVPSAKCTGFELSFGANGRGEITWTTVRSLDHPRPNGPHVSSFAFAIPHSVSFFTVQSPAAFALGDPVSRAP